MIEETESQRIQAAIEMSDTARLIVPKFAEDVLPKLIDVPDASYTTFVDENVRGVPTPESTRGVAVTLVIPGVTWGANKFWAPNEHAGVNVNE